MKIQIKSRSRLFRDIYRKLQTGKLPPEFRVKDVKDILGDSTPFLSKHSIDPNDKNKKAQGNPYFIRVDTGLYRINKNYNWII